ncbi:MAG: hypothetical protein PHV42_02170 [Candidatus Pacebacteria bacterium]|nr:hypothetical protein [Candidatus Paceibacterota bacterium]
MQKAAKIGAIEVAHAGSVLSCLVTSNVEHTALQVYFGRKTKADKPDQVITIKGDSPIDMCCPSVEGTVILCILESGEERIYDTRTGKQLSIKELERRKGEIHFYG